MRVSEKTIEINFCAELTALLGTRYRTIWFGLSQKQEARFGFDTCARLGARMFIFQFKASNYVLKSGERKFKAQHVQMQNLRRLARDSAKSVFYVFPDFGNTLEFQSIPNVISSSYLLDVADLPDPIPPSGRSSNHHHVYAFPGSVRIHSDPFSAKTLPAEKVFWNLFHHDIEDQLKKPSSLNAESLIEKDWLQKTHGNSRRGLYAIGIIPMATRVL